MKEEHKGRVFEVPSSHPAMKSSPGLAFSNANLTTESSTREIIPQTNLVRITLTASGKSESKECQATKVAWSGKHSLFIALDCRFPLPIERHQADPSWGKPFQLLRKFQQGPVRGPPNMINQADKNSIAKILEIKLSLKPKPTKVVQNLDVEPKQGDCLLKQNNLYRTPLFLTGDPQMIVKM